MINLKQIFFLLSFVCCTAMVHAQSPKQEWRSVWFQTVWAGDWPKRSGQASQISEFDDHLARFEKLGINSVCFQVRNMCDAVYRSEIEPWCQWITGTRGGDPGYDPLQVLIEKAHAKGMEVHVWINPYRYASSTTYAQCTGANDYAQTHPEWIKYCDKAGIYVINPSDPAVREQIVKVIKDIITRYDVDGVVFDDYFYQNGYEDSYDDEFYKANNPDGLSRADWRRHQVNLMVRDVHNAIKAHAPWCRFGIGPAGVAASDKDVAAKYGITPCPGSDWQYSSIYSEPVQWFVDHTVDYMSPQVYWPIGAPEDYKEITPWWYYVAHHFNRHCYISQSLSGLQDTNKKKPMTRVSQSAFDAFEIVRQLQLNYTSCLDNAPGMQFFNASGFKKVAFVSVLKEQIWTNKAKVPAMTWYNVPKQGLVDNVTVSGTTVTWTSSMLNVRYGIYAIPKANRHDADIISTSKYYLGMSYGKSFTIADTLTTDKYDFAVTVIDRYGHEWTPRFAGEQKVSTKPTVTLTTPAEGGALLTPGKLCWAPVTDATHYSVQVASDKAMTDILVQYQTGETMLRTRMFECLNRQGTYYWRVMAHVPNAESDWSGVRSCTTRPFSVISPKANATDVSVTPTIEWDNAGAGETYLVEISTNANSFKESYLAYSATTMATSITVPMNTLWYQCEYFVRVSTVSDDASVSAVVPFKTGKTDFVSPQITSPQDGGTLESPTIHLTCDQVPGNGYKFEISTKQDFPTRGGVTKRKITDMAVNYCDFEDMADGVYYAHVAARTSQAVYTAFGATIQFTYTKTTGITDVKVMDNRLPRKLLTPRGMMILREDKQYDLQGKMMK